MFYAGGDNYMKRIASLALSVVFLAACFSFAKDAPEANPFIKVLTALPAAELPAKAADLVSQAKAADREATTVNVVKAALAINPAAAPAVVGAIAQTVPEMASVAAGTAAAAQPRRASAIAKAAAAGAPSQAASVVKAVCRVVPKDYRNVALAVSEAVPGANKDIVLAVEAALPDLKPSLDRALAGYGGNYAPLSDILSQVAPSSTPVAQPHATTVMAGSRLSRGPAIGPPYVNPPATITNVTTGTSGEVPPGGRNYAAP